MFCFQIDVSDAEVNFVAENTSFVQMSANPSVNYEHWKDFGFAFTDKGKFLRKGTNAKCILYLFFRSYKEYTK